MSFDIIDDYLRRTKKRNSKLIGGIFPSILLVFITFGVIFLLFIFTPRDAWFTYKTNTNNIVLKDTMFGLHLKATTDSLYITQGEMTNTTPLSVKVNGEIQTIAPYELRIVYDYTTSRDSFDDINITIPNLLLDNNVLIESNGLNELATLGIHNNYDNSEYLSGFQVNVGQGKSIDWSDKSETVPIRSKTVWSLSTESDVTLLFKYHVQVYLKNVETPINQQIQLISVNDDSQKGKPSIMLEFLTEHPFSFKIQTEKNQTLSYNGYSKEIDIVGEENAVLTVFKTGEPQKYEIPNAAVSVGAKNYPKNQLNSNLSVDKNSKIGGIFSASGTVNKLTVNNESFFQNISQWVQNNISTIITTILTAIITALFAYLTTIQRKN